MTYAQITLILGLMFSLWVINPVGLPNQASFCFSLHYFSHICGHPPNTKHYTVFRTCDEFT